MLNPAERGIRGNSHMIMQDKNRLQIADLILQVDRRARQQAERPKEMTRQRSGIASGALLLALTLRSRK